jgi:hypothetical protein
MTPVARVASAAPGTPVAPGTITARQPAVGRHLRQETSAGGTGVKKLPSNVRCRQVPGHTAEYGRMDGRTFDFEQVDT